MKRGADELAEQMRELQRHINRTQAQLAHCMAEFDAQQGYEVFEYRSARSWAITELHLDPFEASRLVLMSRQLRDLPAVDEAFTAGAVSQAHAALLTRAARQVGLEHVRASLDTLLELATTASPRHLRVATQHLRHCVDPDAADREAVKRYEKRELSAAPTLDGMVVLNGMLDETSGATVIAARNALMPPPRDDDPCTAGQRRADALTELCRRSLDSGDLPSVKGEKPHLVLTRSPPTGARACPVVIFPRPGRCARLSRVAMALNDSIRAALTAGNLAHLVTVNPDGSPHVTVIWVGVEGDEIVSGHLMAQQKLRNVRRDPRVVLSLETGGHNPIGLDEYLVVHGRARLTEGGAPELLQQLARVYLGPDAVFPPMPNPPAGTVMHIEVERVGGVGPWAG